MRGLLGIVGVSPARRQPAQRCTRRGGPDPPTAPSLRAAALSVMTHRRREQTRNISPLPSAISPNSGRRAPRAPPPASVPFTARFERLLNAAGAVLKPRVVCIGELADYGAGDPDFGFFAAAQLRHGAALAGKRASRGGIRRGEDVRAGGRPRSQAARASGGMPPKHPAPEAPQVHTIRESSHSHWYQAHPGAPCSL